MRRTLSAAVLCLLMAVAAVFADTLKLKDGTTLEGKVIQRGDDYWIKLPDGSTKLIPRSQVLSWDKASSSSKPPVDPTIPPIKLPPSAPPSGVFAETKSKADRVEAPVVAFNIWDKFIAANPKSPDLEAAKAEREKWQKLQKDNAEKIKGKWVGGADRKKLVKQAKALVNDGVKQLENGQTTVGFKKFEEALNLYPQSFEANFYLGLHYLKKGAIGSNGRGDPAFQDKAIKTLENAARIAPKSSSVWSNLAVGYSFKGKYQESVKTAYKAALMHESKDTVQNLVSTIRYGPRGMQDQAWCKPIMENTILMAERHQIQLGSSGGGFVYIPPIEGEEVPGGSGPPGEVWSGSGFFVTTDGYLITNHHVATGDPKEPIKPEISFLVRMDDGTEKPADLIAVDDAADIAIMKIQPEKPVVPLKISGYLPNQGSEALVLGYPATGEDEMTMQISNGTVKSVHAGEEFEVWFNLNTTHGNSGGPIVDAGNNVIAILTAGRESFNMVITLGVGSHQIKTFLEKIGDKAPKLEYAEMPTTLPTFSSENLTKTARTSTVLVMAIRSPG